MKDLKGLKIAIVHDWLVGGGGESVVFELHKMFPNAPIYTSYCTDDWRKRLDNKVITGFLQHWPFSKLRKYLPVLRIWWFTHLDLKGYNLVISSSGNGEAKGIHVPEGTLHICYCHSQTHFYWRHYAQYLRQPGFGIFNPLARAGLKLLVGPLRKWDLRASKRPDYFIANSTHIQADIKKYYGRDSIVISPPVDIGRFIGSSAPKRHGFVTIGRQVPYKHTDIIVGACTQLGLKLKVIGNGPEHKNLCRLAGPTITLLTNVSNNDIPKHLTKAAAFLFASFEDFGITPVEAMAAGTPVIAYKGGGALGYVKPSETGEFFESQTAESLVKILEKFDPSEYDHQKIQASVRNFSQEAFRQNFSIFIDEKIK